MKCPWCERENGELVKIMYLGDSWCITEMVCKPCRKAWLKRLKDAVEGKK